MDHLDVRQPAAPAARRRNAHLRPTLSHEEDGRIGSRRRQHEAREPTPAPEVGDVASGPKLGHREPGEAVRHVDVDRGRRISHRRDRRRLLGHRHEHLLQLWAGASGQRTTRSRAPRAGSAFHVKRPRGGTSAGPIGSPSARRASRPGPGASSPAARPRSLRGHRLSMGPRRVPASRAHAASGGAPVGRRGPRR